MFQKYGCLEGGHPHSTYAQIERGRGQAKRVHLRTREEGGGRSRFVRTQKKKSQNFSIFVQKKLLHCYLLLCVEKCKPALSYK